MRLNHNGILINLSPIIKNARKIRRITFVMQHLQKSGGDSLQFDGDYLRQYFILYITIAFKMRLKKMK